MFNMIRMECYRMFKTKALYVIWIVMAAVTIMTTAIAASESKDSKTQEENYETAKEIEENGSANIGISVVVPTKPGEKVTLYDIFYGNAQGMALALFVVIFTIIYATADFNSGYIKNIGGQVRNRNGLIAAKVVSLCVFTVCTIGVYLAIQAVSNRIFFGYLEWGAADMLLKYLLTTVLLHIALAVICMAIAVVLRNNLVSMILAVCMCFHVLQIVYSGIDKVVHKIGFEDFRTMKYTVTGRISMLPMEPGGKDCASAVILSAVFFVAAAVIAGAVFRKRDI